MTTPTLPKVYALHERTPTRPPSRLARRRRLSDALLIVAGVLLLVALVSASLLPVLAALPLAGLGLRLSTRRVIRRYVDLGPLEAY